MRRGSRLPLRVRGWYTQARPPFDAEAHARVGEALGMCVECYRHIESEGHDEGCAKAAQTGGSK